MLREGGFAKPAPTRSRLAVKEGDPRDGFAGPRFLRCVRTPGWTAEGQTQQESDDGTWVHSEDAEPAPTPDAIPERIQWAYFDKTDREKEVIA